MATNRRDLSSEKHELTHLLRTRHSSLSRVFCRHVLNFSFIYVLFLVASASRCLLIVDSSEDDADDGRLSIDDEIDDDPGELGIVITWSDFDIPIN